MWIGAQIVGAWLAKHLISAYPAAQFSIGADVRWRVEKLRQMER
jgi:ribose 5-phosphate isomerase B